MGKRWAAVLLALVLLGAVFAPPLVEARNRAVKNAEPEEAVALEDISTEGSGETGQAPATESAELAEDLAELRALEVAGIPAEDRDAACYALYRGLLPPGENGDFGGEKAVSRGEAVQALYRLSGVRVRPDQCPYEDVPEPYQDAAAWAHGAGVSGGVTEDRFAPDVPVTRSQLAVMLYRFSAWRGEDTQAEAAEDVDGEDIPANVKEALDWVLSRGLYEGMTGLYPALPVSRLQFAKILARLQRTWDPLAAELTLRTRETASLSRQKHEALSAAVSAAARRHGAVGVQVAVIEHGAVTDTYCYGWAVKGAIPMTGQHKLRTASLSKVAVGISAALLQEEGAVDYDADIGVYWGQYARNPRYPDIPVTVRSMLTHTSTLLNSENIAWNYDGVKAQLGSAAGYGGGTPGSLDNWSYNNHAFGILGQTLELASGRFLDDVLDERLLTPLGADGSFTAGDLKRPELTATLYREASLSRSTGSLQSVHRWKTPGATGRQFPGGFTASALDMAKLTAVLAGDGCFEGVRLMEAGSVELMESYAGQALPEGGYQAMPLRLRFDAYGREGIYYHTGSAYGAYNLLSYDPFTGDGVVVLTTGADGGKDACGIYAICGEISQAVYDAIKG